MDMLEEMGQAQSGQQKQEGATAPKTANIGGVASGEEEGEPTQVAISVAQGGGRRRRGRKGKKSHRKSHKKSHKRSTHHRKSRRQH